MGRMVLLARRQGKLAPTRASKCLWRPNLDRRALQVGVKRRVPVGVSQFAPCPLVWESGDFAVATRKKMIPLKPAGRTAYAIRVLGGLGSLRDGPCRMGSGRHLVDGTYLAMRDRSRRWRS